MSDNPKKKSKKSLAETHPQLASEADGWDPNLITHGSERKVAWKCANGHKWETAVIARTSKNSKCVECKKTSAILGFDDLTTTDPVIAAEAYGWDPTKYRRGSKTTQNWQCPLGHLFKAKINTRASGKIQTKKSGQVIRYESKCPYCTNKRVLVGFNDLATTHPEIATEAHGWNPETVTAGSAKKLEFKCPNGCIYPARIKSRTQGHDCPNCALSGFRPDGEAYIYLLEQEEWGYMKIGISTSLKKRINNHHANRWIVREIYGPLLGRNAFTLEQSMLKYIQANGGQFNLEKRVKKFAGFSEAWITESFPVTSIKVLIKLAEDEENR